ncbi:cytochrome b [Devosia sp. A449]
MTGNSPNSPSPQDRYDVITIAFHWITAVPVLVLFGSALVWNSTPRDWDLDWLEDLHVSLGIALAVVLVGRLAWRVFASRRLPGAGAPVMQLASKLVHGILYVLLALQVVLGVGLRWYRGRISRFSACSRSLSLQKPIASYRGRYPGCMMLRPGR